MGDLKNLKNLTNIRFYKETVLNKEFMTDLIQIEDFDYIYHLAAVASVADSLNRTQYCNSVNLVSTIIILEALKGMSAKSLKRLVFSSSAAVYGDNQDLPKTEKSEIKPLSPYAIDKFTSETYVKLYNDLYGIPTSCVRFFNVFGPNQNPKSEYSGVISILADKYFQFLNGEDVYFTLYGDGTQTRDFIFVEDVISALELISKSKESLGKVYNIGTGNEVQLNEVIAIFNSIFDIELPVKFEKSRQGDIPKSYADISKIRSLGFTPKYSVRDGLIQYIKYLK